MALTPMNTAQLQAAIASNRIVMAYFWTEWDEHAMKTMPLIEKLSDTVKEEGVVICSINADEEGFLALDLYVTNLPTVIFYENGEERDRLPGPHTLETYEKTLDLYVNPQEIDPFELINSSGYIDY